MSQGMGMSAGMEQSLNPKMIAFYALLQQPSVELEQAIDTELQDNPALDVTAFIFTECNWIGMVMISMISNTNITSMRGVVFMSTMTSGSALPLLALPRFIPMRVSFEL